MEIVFGKGEYELNFLHKADNGAIEKISYRAKTFKQLKRQIARFRNSIKRVRNGDEKLRRKLNGIGVITYGYEWLAIRYLMGNIATSIKKGNYA